MKMDSDEMVGSIVDDFEAVANTNVVTKPSKSHEPHHRRISKALYEIDTWDTLVYSFAAILFILPLVNPQYEVAFLFGIALIFSLFTRSVPARIAMITFSAIYFTLILLIGSYFEISEIFNLIFGINVITLVPMAVGILMSVLAMTSGALHGLFGHTRYAGAWIVAIAFVSSLADTLIAVFLFGDPDWHIIFTVHLAVYLTAFIISWGIFYLVARLIRYGVRNALR
jgi:hypothetical protein